MSSGMHLVTKIILLIEHFHMLTRFVIPGICTARAAMYEAYRNEERAWLAYWMGTAIMISIEGSVLGRLLYWFVIDSKKRTIFVGILRLLVTHWMAWLDGSTFIQQFIHTWIREREALIEIHLSTLEKHLASLITEATLAGRRWALQFATDHAWELWRLAKCYATAKSAATEFYASVKPTIPDSVFEEEEEEDIKPIDVSVSKIYLNTQPPACKKKKETMPLVLPKITIPHENKNSPQLPPRPPSSPSKKKNIEIICTNEEEIPLPVPPPDLIKKCTTTTEKILPPSETKQKSIEPPPRISTTRKEKTIEKTIKNSRQRNVESPLSSSTMAAKTSIAARVASRHRTSTVSTPRLKAALDRASAPLRRSDNGVPVDVHCRVLDEQGEDEQPALKLLLRISGHVLQLSPSGVDTNLTLLWPSSNSPLRKVSQSKDELDDELDDFSEDGAYGQSATPIKKRMQAPHRTPLAAVRFVRRTTKRVRLVYHQPDGTCCLLTLDFATSRAATTHADSFRSLSDKARSRAKAAVASRARRLQRDAFDAWFLSHLFRPKCLDT